MFPSSIDRKRRFRHTSYPHQRQCAERSQHQQYDPDNVGRTLEADSSVNQQMKKDACEQDASFCLQVNLGHHDRLRHERHGKEQKRPITLRKSWQYKDRQVPERPHHP